MEDEGSQDEQTELPEPVCKPLQVASLRQHCLLTLIRYRDALRECITRKTHNAFAQRSYCVRLTGLP